jgi:hypothetical protein
MREVVEGCDFWCTIVRKLSAVVFCLRNRNLVINWCLETHFRTLTSSYFKLGLISFCSYIVRISNVKQSALLQKLTYRTLKLFLMCIYENVIEKSWYVNNFWSRDQWRGTLWLARHYLHKWQWLLRYLSQNEDFWGLLSRLARFHFIFKHCCPFLVETFIWGRHA